ncbi:MAG: AarF/ABC1/UbiB kinase family protein [Candidatus Azambacteria bacterium]|nr:AarF/ABC1/UbiB kinase family protein [Candidatus Azambacteria bacterium]
MSIFKIKSGLGDINRLRKIFVVIFEAGGGIFVEKIRLRYLVPWSCRVHCFFKPRPPKNCLVRMENEKPIVSGTVLREVLEKLGPTFIKFGQVLSLRADVVGEDISQELAKLQSDVKPFSYEEARRIIQEDLGKEPETLFKSIEKRPIAAASLAQVHRAFLKNGEELAVKVQRPNIRKTIEQDIHILLYLGHLAERFIPELRPYQPLKVIKEFADWTMRELDFSAEGRNADRFRYAFREKPHITIPRIYWEYTTPRVLTMEFMHGVKADDLEGMKKLRVDTKQLARYGVDAMLQQFLIDGFFHADPHPGNFFAQKGEVLCLHDFGMVGYLTQEQRKELINCFMAFVNKDTEGFLKHFSHLAIINQNSDVPGFEKDVINILNELFFSPHPQIAWIFFRAINKGASRNISFPADLTLFGKAIITTEAMGMKLYPEFDFSKELAPFVDKVWREYLSPKKLIRTLESNLFDYLEFLKNLPERTQNMLEKIEKGEVGVRIDAQDLLGIKTEFDRQNDLRILGMTLAAVILATIGFFYVEGRRTIGGIPISSFGLAITALLFLWFILKLKKGPKQ